MDYAADPTNVYDDITLDPAMNSVGLPVGSDTPFDWAGLGDFINGVAPVAIAGVAAVTGKTVNVSGSNSPGAFSVSSGPTTASAGAGLSASPASQAAVAAGAAWSPVTLVLLAAGAFLLVKGLIK